MGVRAWMAVVGGFSAQMCSFGYTNVIGIFQTYYTENQLHDLTPSTIAWIGSTQTFILSFGGLICGRIHDAYGPRYLTVPGAVMLIAGSVGTAFSTEYWQFMLSQGILTALGASCLFYATTSSVSRWFDVKRGLALGIAASGSSIGGIILPMVFNYVVAVSSYKVAVLAMSAVLGFFAIITALTTTSRMPPERNSSYQFVRFYVKPFAEPSFGTLAIGFFFVFLGIFVPFGFVASQAVQNGFTDADAFFLLAYMNGGSFFGRVITGWLADRVGKYNMYISSALVAGIITIALWIPAHTVPTIVLYSVLYGYFSGAVLGMYPAVVAQISPNDEIGTRIGAISSFMSFASLSGLPIAGAVLTTGGGSFFAPSMFAGVSMLVGTGFVVVSKYIYSEGRLSSKI
ncbi:major facilitator superfamily domain-containing protein [Dipodascopsis tothii]|uniref:major facilitator superfamily domain-containing protein n=1 Tax=Dipodascopsis tothii TaxID=44089 RepID=UPI0034CF61CF